MQAQLGQKDEARRSYQKFFEIWKDADPNLPLLVQAREEFAKLRSHYWGGDFSPPARPPDHRIVVGAFCPSGISVTYFWPASIFL